MRRKIPSTASLAAFEAAARHRSFTLAADELAVTQSAVCRQIGGLESFLGVKLFRRSRRGVTLTAAGMHYSRVVRARLDEVERDTLELMSKGNSGGSLELGVVPTFATRWLIPRLPDFHRLCPGITLNLHVQTRPFLFDESGLDAAIHAGAQAWPGTRSDVLMDERMVAVGAASMLGKRKWLRTEELARRDLLQSSTRPHAWRDWFTSLGMSVPNALAGPRFELFSMIIEAARHGLGAALVPRLLVEPELADGSLRLLVEHESASGQAYRLVFPEHMEADETLQRLRGWLRENSARGMSALQAPKESA
jgi:LysR family glycine cleavage system transcriptional activator